MMGACPTSLGYVFSKLGPLSNTTPRFLADVDGSVSDPELGINYVQELFPHALEADAQGYFSR